MQEASEGIHPVDDTLMPLPDSPAPSLPPSPFPMPPFFSCENLVSSACWLTPPTRPRHLTENMRSLITGVTVAAPCLHLCNNKRPGHAQCQLGVGGGGRGLGGVTDVCRTEGGAKVRGRSRGRKILRFDLNYQEGTDCVCVCEVCARVCVGRCPWTLGGSHDLLTRRTLCFCLSG